jgi:hypothetical protein
MACDPEESKQVLQGLKEALAEQHECYVLITCKKHDDDGKLQVEMTYEGDSCLAAYLVESAQQFI